MTKLCVFVATGEEITQPILDLCRSLNISCQETKLHVGDILIAEVIDPQTTDTQSTDAQSIDPQSTDAQSTDPPNIPPSPKLTRNQIIMENLPQIQKSQPELVIEPLLLIERKTIKDFCDSLTSQHKKEQTLRMLQYRQNLGCSLRLAFVVEGYLQFKENEAEFIHEKTPIQLESAFFKLQIRDQITVQQVYNIQDHIQWIKYSLDIFQREPDLTTRQRNLYQEYLHEALKIDKKSNLTTQTTYLVQLTCFQNVSMDVAQAIAGVYPSFSSLLSAWKVHPKPEKMLAEIKITITTNKNKNKSGASRRLGPVLSAKIYQAMNRN